MEWEKNKRGWRGDYMGGSKFRDAMQCNARLTPIALM
jgi:hypothetical protein